MRKRFKAPSPALIVALVALFVALGGTALAATATIVNIADPTTPANKAKVDATGALKTAGIATVSGYVGQTAPKTPFFGTQNLPDEGMGTLINANKATVALTRFDLDNYFGQPNGARAHVQLFEEAGKSTVCDGSGGLTLVGEYDAAAGQTFTDAMQSPIVLKPLVAGGVWCLMAAATVEGDPSGGYSEPGISFSGYVVSGSLPSGAVPAAKEAGVVRRAAR